MPRRTRQPDTRTPRTITATQRLTTAYGHPGPYTTVYLGTRPLLPGNDADTFRRWEVLRQDLEVQGAPRPALDAIEARLGLPAPDDAAAIAVIAAADGATVVDHGLEPPRLDVGVVDTLPYAAPMLEWHQRRVPHLVVTLHEDGADVAVFGLDHYQRLETIDSGDHPMSDEELVVAVADLATAITTELVVVAGHPDDTTNIADRLRRQVQLSCRVVTEPLTLDTDDLADATVRHVSDVAARTTVRYLRERRFLATHGAAVDGVARTLDALATGTADLLLIHDDPRDQRRCWIGTEPRQLSLTDDSVHRYEARLVDAAIRSAVLQDIPVHIIPATGPGGPEDDTAALILGDGEQPTL